MTASLRDWQRRFPATPGGTRASPTLSFQTGRCWDEAETCLFSGKLGYCTCFKHQATIMAWWGPHPRRYESDSGCIGSLTLMTLHWCITCSNMLMATWWNINGDDTVHMGNIWKDVLTKWRHGRREVDVTWILLYQRKVTTVFHLCWHIYVVHVWMCAHCLSSQHRWVHMYK